ncbi:hypothetical protein NT6N_37290 [Oceaniferula spumae]|uniref:Gamma-butyrobetaine hydroxylase-like N-terminal domain-containing protein n=1 Tax=Oceaniferula spumae TaxID=2979115 RepID=A0AAT9FS26_9BACT
MSSITLTNHAVIGNELALSWGDGRENFITLEKLRQQCPCALCQGEPDALGRVVKPSVIHTERSFQLLSLTQVGGYALQLKWADGHSSGIYTFDLLRSLS